MTAPASARAATTHKEDTAVVSPSAVTVPDWRPAVVSWFAGGPKPGMAIMRIARQAGIGEYPPAQPRDRVRVLALAGFDVEDIIAAVPSLNPVDVASIVDRIPGQAYSIIDAHLAGLTPLEVAAETGISRPRVYYWLGKAGLKPNKRTRDELTARQRAQVVKAWQAGEPMAGIARRFGVSYDQVRYAVKQAS